MDNEDGDFGGNMGAPMCGGHRFDMARFTTRELVYHVLAFIAGLRDDFPDRFEHLEEVVQEESNDWKVILEEIGDNIGSLQGAIEDCVEGMEGDDGVKALLHTVEEQITEGQDRISEGLGTCIRSNEMITKLAKDAVVDALNAHTKVLQKEIRSLRRAIHYQGRPFHQFRKLPTEIRLMIWDLAIPRRMVCFKESLHENPLNPREIVSVHYELVSPLPPPSVAQVCRESRAVACKHGKLSSIRNMEKPPWSTHPKSMSPKWAWFDASRDSIFLQPQTRDLEGIDALREFTKRAHYVTIDYGMRGNHTPRLLDSLYSPIAFPMLKSIDFVGETFVQPHRSDPVLEARVFSREGTYPIPIEKHDATARDALIRKLVAGGHCSSDVDSLIKFLNAKENTDGLPHDEIHYNDEAWNNRQKYLYNKWFNRQYEWDVLGGVGNEEMESQGIKMNKLAPGLTCEWMLMMEPMRPTARRVALLRLETDTCYE
ncbi:hypothetical protein F5B19DRAFT_367177 [Rostrohypoxylon terebratum]|nr:hypothetical protein F5B19DRAFT_367177 [Rostrohypoxylon terebratum]